ncbi:MAG TPA: PVC-type heme-binding CxxCH protein [Candidatus Saccharimonadia bacterium]|nr:PVC-type heme-binding CxxCH protein [Candidatus Saccharimonadia bacterium]
MKPHSLLPFAASLLCVPLFSAAQSPTQTTAPLAFPSVPATPPDKAASTFDVLDGFTMQLVAAEPLVTDPVAITYDESGRAFVCEMNDYPYTDKVRHKPSQENPTDLPIGKVRLLADSDGDGTYDRSTIFADNLSWPTGAACWKGGIIVVATPDIWYLKDTDNDGVADVRQKLFTGLKKLNVQAVANNPIWGLDNKIYIAGGTNGGTVQNLIHPDEKPVTIRRADLRLDPVTMKIEATDGGARFGNTRDDWGNRFLCNIRNPCQHIVLDTRYLSRNPHLPAVTPLHDAAEAGDQLPVHRISPPEAWRVLRADRWSTDPATRMPRSELVGAGVVTSSAGITIYRGDAYPKEYRGMAFVADVAGNLFYRLKLTPDGVTFKATRVDGDKEFCASRDIWFRPVNFANAPDGCLHVCDMYREAIEHPWSLPDDIHAAIDLIK